MIWFSSDQHFWHANVIQYCNRPFKSVEEMNEKLIANWNSVVKPEDTVYCLGDFSLAFRSVELYSHRLLGNKMLVPGNHDHLHSYHKRARKLENRLQWIKKYEEYGWTVLPEQSDLSVIVDDRGLYHFKLCHMPGADDHNPFDDKYERWRPILSEDDWLLCGHIHEKWKTKRKMINVGVDVWDMKPVSIREIADIVDSHGL